jgi:hypothetical protein
MQRYIIECNLPMEEHQGDKLFSVGKGLCLKGVLEF